MTKEDAEAKVMPQGQPVIHPTGPHGDQVEKENDHGSTCGEKDLLHEMCLSQHTAIHIIMENNVNIIYSPVSVFFL